MNEPDWATHGIVMGVLVGIGLVVSAFNHLFTPKSMWISLKGVIAFFLWILIAAYAVASRLTSAFGCGFALAYGFGFGSGTGSGSGSRSGTACSFA